jgi:hypothetical protein
VLPEQGRSLAPPVCCRASTRRHGAAASSARTGRHGYLTLTAGRGYWPAPVATAAATASTACAAVATTGHPMASSP